MTGFFVYGLLMVVLLGIVWRYRYKAGISKLSKIMGSHQRKVQTSYQLLIKINDIAKSGRWQSALAYLRKIDAYVFEELILTTLEKKYGALALRNHRYSGDGGIDGGFILRDKKFFVQAKRYQGHVKADDISKFKDIMLRGKVEQGLFVHTGKTPKIAKSNDDQVIIISGERLIRFFTGKEKFLLY